MNKYLLLLILTGCNASCDSTVTVSSSPPPVVDAASDISCIAHSAITGTKALVVATVFCPANNTFRAEISIFDKDGFACGNTQNKVICGQSAIYECSASGLETITVRYALNGALSLMDCPIVKR